MSNLRVTSLRGRTSGKSPELPDGVVITGVATATSFSGTSGEFTGNVSVGGTLTYEDVTNVDSVGIITAQSGIRVGAGQSIGSTTATESVVYYGDGSNLQGISQPTSFDVTSSLFI
tara:strand:+ start:321 stop:668 length:348 start_codon:yes stop_codon:yes gene_type:complete